MEGREKRGEKIKKKKGLGNMIENGEKPVMRRKMQRRERKSTQGKTREVKHIT